MVLDLLISIRNYYHQPVLINTDSFDFSRSIKVGKASLESERCLINEPFDFVQTEFTFFIEYATGITVCAISEFNARRAAL